MSRESLLDEAITKAKEAEDWQLVEWLRMARGGESAARWYTGKFSELQAENDKLVMKLNAEHLVRQNVECENAKLRELVEDMAAEIRGLGVDFGRVGWCDYADRIRELGVEV